MAMMQEGGEKKAAMAIGLLHQKASEAGAAAAVVECGGVRTLVQTAVLHPISEMRLGAAAVLTACAQQDDANFMRAGLEQRLPEAFLRCLHEGDRRAKPEGEESKPEEGSGGFEEAVDPDKPLRRVAIVGLRHMLASKCEGIPDGVLKAPQAVSVLFRLGTNTDPALRREAVHLLLALCGGTTDVAGGASPDKRPAVPVKLEAVCEAATAGADEAAQNLLTAIHDADEDVRCAAISVLLLLRACDKESCSLKSALQAIDAAKILSGDEESAAAASAEVREAAKALALSSNDATKAKIGELLEWLA